LLVAVLQKGEIFTGIARFPELAAYLARATQTILSFSSKKFAGGFMAANRQLLLTRLSERLHVLFDGLINQSGVASKPSKDQESYFLTRALVAVSLMDDAGLQPTQAVRRHFSD
jgi:hypothetical protein